MTEKKVFISHSAFEDWSNCPELYYLKKQERLESIHKGVSLPFGVAIDTALSFVLEKHKEGKIQEGVDNVYKVFLEHKEKGFKLCFGDLNTKYRLNDYDHKVLDEESKNILKHHEEEKNIKFEQVEEKIDKKQDLTEDEEFLLNVAGWLTLNVKAQYMIKDFIDNILPKVKKVHAVQQKVTGSFKTNNGTAITTSYIDWILDFEGYDKPVVIDLKTSSSFYDSNAVFLSKQLTLYLAAIGKELGTNLAGYVVLLKNLTSDSKCSKCGYIKQSTHRTCNNEVDGKRCNGDWITTYKGNHQILVDEISEQRQQMFLNSYVNFAQIAEQNIRVQNWNHCWAYNRPCDMYDACHHGDFSKLRKRS